MSQHQQPDGNPAELSTSHVIVDAVGKDLLREIDDDYLNLPETSAAVYERNGDYALGIFSSGWCRFMDESSYNLCGTRRPPEPLDGGQCRGRRGGASQRGTRR